MQYRRSAKARTWAEAEGQRQYLIEQMSAGNAPATPTVTPTIHSLVEAFVTSKQSQRIGDTTVKRHKRELSRLADFLGENGVFVPNAITAAALYKFRETWKTLYPASSTQREAQQRIRQFLRFLHEGLARRMRAVVRLIWHSGLAIGDAVTLKRGSLVFDKKKNVYRVVTSRQKTGTHVSVLIPADVAKELLSVANGNPEYVFWGNRGGQKKTVVKDYQKDFRRLFLATSLGNFASHSLRDTFSVDLLQRGVPLEEVSKLLGHSSTKVTEKHYAPWIKGRQDRLDSFMLPIVSGKKSAA